MRSLGISCFYHNAAAALVSNGKLDAAVEEERFSRVKNDARFPHRSIEYCLRKISGADIDTICFYERPLAKLARSYRYADRQQKKRLSTYRAIFELDELRREIASRFGSSDRLRFVSHHAAHAASAYYCSGFERAAVLVVDGVGEAATASIFVGAGADLTLIRDISYPNSIGLAYTAVTKHLGFEPLRDEYKIMGLAAYGSPRFRESLRSSLVSPNPDGSFSSPCFIGENWTDRTVQNVLSEYGPERQPDAPLQSHHLDLAASIQAVTEEAIVGLVRAAKQCDPSIEHLCLAGGVALNCKANAAIADSAKFKKLFVQPASGDAGAALGAALLGQPKDFRHVQAFTPSTGPEFSEEEIRRDLDAENCPHKRYDNDELLSVVAEELAKGHTVGWFQGRMEFGPRALGFRSILANPILPHMAERLNILVKERESFRPFAPSVPADDAPKFFDALHFDPFMLATARVRDEYRTLLPSTTHVDGTARVHAVIRNQNELFYALLRRFEHHSGVPILLNTSFNHSSEPIVCTPKNALHTFQRCDLDLLAIGPFIVRQPAAGLGSE